MFNEHAHLRDGGAAIHGISRAAFNKIVGVNFHTGMRKLSRNGNQSKLVREEHTKLARHFLKVRWRDPEDVEDRWILSTVFNTMYSHNVQDCVDLLREFQQYKAGPAGRGKGLGLGACNGRPPQCNSRENISSLVPFINNDDLAENTGPQQCVLGHAHSRQVDQIATHHAYSCQPSFHDTDENKIASELVAAVRAGHAMPSIHFPRVSSKAEHDSWKVIRSRKQLEPQMEPMISSPSSLRNSAQDDTARNEHDYNNPQIVQYEEPALNHLAFQIDMNEIIESYFSSDHSYDIFSGPSDESCASSSEFSASSLEYSMTTTMGFDEMQVIHGDL